MDQDPRLGAQLWVERDTDGERLDRLVAAAAAFGLGVLRVFLVWPWIEPRPGEWDFARYDAVFDTAARHGVGIKATLGPDSPPWHQGTPGLVQSGHVTMPSTTEQRRAIRRYLEACVRRYAGHPALRQWILWNEPVNPVVPPGEVNHGRGDELRARWHELLRKRYADDLDALNARWLTGYASFEDVPFPEEIPHPAHRTGVFFSFAPWLADAELRSRALRDELAWVRDVIGGLDPRTPTCFNLPDLYRNHAELGYDLGALTSAADVAGLSLHAPWHLGFADRSAHPALLAAGIGLLRQLPGVREVELTEVQTGNVVWSAPDPSGVTPAELAASYLAPLLAGATNATGWCLNARERDVEAGDWALLDDDDGPGPRTAAVLRVREAVHALDERLGAWTPAPPDAYVLVSEEAEAVDLVSSWTGRDRPGRGPNEAVQGAGLLAVELLRLGVAASPAPVSALERGDEPPALLVASGLSSWSAATVAALLDRVRDGGTLLVDAGTGRKDLDAGLHRPWPGFLSGPLGFRVAGLATRPDGHPVTLHGLDAGRLPLYRAEPAFTDGAWAADPAVRLPLEADAPCLWERPYGAGRVLFFAGRLGAALVHDDRTRAVARYVLDRAASGLDRPVRPVDTRTAVLPVRGERGTAVGVLAPPVTGREGRDVRIALPAGVTYDDLWSGAAYPVPPDGELLLPAPDGLALLVPQPPRAQ